MLQSRLFFMFKGADPNVTDWKVAGTVVDAGSWVNAANISTGDGNFASVTRNGWLLDGTPLRLRNFNVDLPAGAVVTHLEFSIVGYITVSPAVNPNYENTALRLTKETSGEGSSLGWITLNSLLGSSSVERTAMIDVSTVQVDGAALSTWTVADWNSANLTAHLPTISTTDNFSAGANITAYVDLFRFRLHYTL